MLLRHFKPEKGFDREVSLMYIKYQFWTHLVCNAIPQDGRCICNPSMYVIKNYSVSIFEEFLVHVEKKSIHKKMYHYFTLGHMQFFVVIMQ